MGESIKQINKVERGFEIVTTKSMTKDELRDDFDKLILQEKQARQIIINSNKFIKCNKDLILTEEEEKLRLMLERINNSKTLKKHQENLVIANKNLDIVSESKKRLYVVMPELMRIK